jgi:hypothetical protein
VNEVKIIVLSRYADLFAGFRENVDRLEPKIGKVLVRDGDEIDYEHLRNSVGWDVCFGKSPFVYAANVNHGWSAYWKQDVIICGDDIRFEEPFVEKLQYAAYSAENVGVATVQLWGQSPFVCGYFKRQIINQVGSMDERFVGYGKEDCDWCRRMETLGFYTLPTEIKAKHSGGTSFLRRAKELGTSMEELCNTNNRIYEGKWPE